MSWAELPGLAGADELIDSMDLRWLFDDPDEPNENCQAVAWELLVELRTRVSIQPLHFLDGDEGAALESLYKLFPIVRDLLREHQAGAYRTAVLTTEVMNRVVRPLTAHWHRRKLAGDFAKEDACRDFRTELALVQEKLRQYERLLYFISCGAKASDPRPPEAKCAVIPLGDPIPYDLLLGWMGAPDHKQPPVVDPASQQEIVKAERAEIETRRAAVSDDEDEDGVSQSGSENLVGLAFSGGGIRSATFGLGVVQTLAARGILPQVDLISTVSGGGYLGSMLSSILNMHPGDPPRDEPLQPFQPEHAGDSNAVRYLRNHSRYVLPSTLGHWLGTAGQAAFGIISNLIILSALVFVFVLLTHEFMGAQLHEMMDGRWQPIRVWKLTVGLWIAGAVCMFLIPPMRRLGRLPEFSKLRHFWERLTIGFFLASLLITFINYVPLAHYGYAQVVGAMSEVDTWAEHRHRSVMSIGVALLNVGGLMLARSRRLFDLGARMPRIRNLLFLVLWMSGPALMIFAYLELSRVHASLPMQTSLTVVLLACSILYGLMINVNFTSMHRYYRNRLSDTYLLRARQDGSVEPVDHQLLSELRGDSRSTAPYHLINAALNLPAAKHVQLRGRNCDFFLFSKHYCGSPVLGYAATKRWEAADPHLDLGTAVAISGAAAAPQMGMGSIKGASFLLTLLNVRLGYWLHRPRQDETPPSRMKGALHAPGPDYLLREAFNRIDDQAHYFNVSDGGHIENLGLYELLRRRCKFVVAVDGECDPQLVFPSLMRLQHFAAVDMNIRIEMDLARVKWNEIQAAEESTGKEPAEGEAKACGYSRGHFAVGRIHYPDGKTGWLVYIKLSVTGNEPCYVLDYRRRHCEFPHESTADQVFGEDQFEAYRVLGQHATEDLFSPELLSAESRRLAEQQRLPVEEWFQELANCFFQDRS